MKRPTARSVIPSIVPLLRHSDRNIRLNAVIALGKMGPFAKQSASDVLLTINDGDGGVRNAAKDSLTRIGIAALPMMARAMVQDSSHSLLALQVLPKIGNAALLIQCKLWKLSALRQKAGVTYRSPDQKWVLSEWVLSEAITNDTLPFEVDDNCRAIVIADSPRPPLPMTLDFLSKGLAVVKEHPPDPRKGYTPIEWAYSTAFLLGALGRAAVPVLPRVKEAQQWGSDLTFSRIVRFATELALTNSLDALVGEER